MIVFFFFYNMIPCSLGGTGLSPPSSPLGGRNRRRRRHHILLVLPRNPLIHSSQLVPRGHLCECTDGGNTLGASTCMMTIIHDDLNTFQEKLEHILHTKERECLSSANQSSNNDTLGCPSVWDGILCWPWASSGSLSVQACPEYIIGFEKEEVVTKWCTSEGTWYSRPDINKTWSNYTLCWPESGFGTVITGLEEDEPAALLKSWFPVLKGIREVGYSVSLCTLAVAFILLSSIKKLRCPRNTLHRHLFVSFMLRAAMALLKDTLFVQGVGLPGDVVLRKGDLEFVENYLNWQCKLVTSLYQLFILANYSWILMEGLYLHNLIYLAPFSDGTAITLYVCLGWGLPVLFVVPWVAARATFEDTLCWTTHNHAAVFLIIRTPVIASVLISFGLFVNIARVLLLKFRSSIYLERRKHKYRRWAKSTLVLVPLFGAHYALFLAMSFSIGVDPAVELAWLICDQLFGSFQGFLVSLLYCLLTAEVRGEVGRRWRGFRRSSNSVPSTARHSLTLSRLYIAPGRASWSWGTAWRHHTLLGGEIGPQPGPHAPQTPPLLAETNHPPTTNKIPSGAPAADQSWL